ncbi:caspase family protein [Pseudomonas sp.]|uniref:caspase family protein n=1 Tax=Pseudomonas sp. TaxID=306 RepID=UPI00299F4B20|nr:caspase family protein [Pseudomonas sp.]MDX1366890.1 caspase family protein [Pseudomonas sp.]
MEPLFLSQAVKDKPESTATHVLLVGCGEYPAMGQTDYSSVQPLDSPHTSVQEMVNWYLGGVHAMPAGQEKSPHEAFSNPDAPLGSLTALVSPSINIQTPPGGNVACERPTLANIRKAYRQWYERLGANPESVGVFYFCGHGVSDGVNQFLIADDFGEDGVTWANTFHVSNTHQATIRATSARIVYVIDACREFSDDVLDQLDIPRGLTEGTKKGKITSVGSAILRSTSANRLAYTPDKGVTYFTQALLQALRGHCGEERDIAPGVFDVRPSELQVATAALLNHLLLLQPNLQQHVAFESEGTHLIALNVLDRIPDVLVEMDIDPAVLRQISQAYLENSVTPRQLKALSDGPASFRVPRGEWHYGAEFNQDGYQVTPKHRYMSKVIFRDNLTAKSV